MLLMEGQSSPSFICSVHHINAALASVPACSLLSRQHQMIRRISWQVPTACLATKLASCLKPCKQNDYRGDGGAGEGGGAVPESAAAEPEVTVM